MNGLNRICEYCGNKFQLNPRLGLMWAEKSGRGKYCSRSCKVESHKGKHYSPETEFRSENMAWDKHPGFKDGLWSYRRFRKSECEDCGSIAELHVHHINRNRRDNREENLRTLCKDCHWTYHRGNRTAWNKGKKTGSLTLEHRARIGQGVRNHYAK